MEPRKRFGEGNAALRYRCPNTVRHGLRSTQKFMIRETKHAIPIGLEPARTRFVVSRTGVLAVLAAVKVNNELCSGAIEIGDVGTDGLLSAEAQTCHLFHAQECPKPTLGLCGRTTQFPGQPALRSCAGL